MKLFEHPDFEQAVLRAAEHFRSQGLRPAIIEKDYYVTEALRIAELAKAKKKPPTRADIEKVFNEGFYLPFAHKFAFERLLGEAKKLVGTYLADYSSDLLRVWETERPFELHLEKGIVSGRADVILDMEGEGLN